MSLSSPLPLETTRSEETLEKDAAQLFAAQNERSNFQPVLFLFPTVVATLSWLAGGISLLTDFSFLLMTVLCGVFLLAELRSFSFRWGIGGLLVHGGSLIWFFYDYFDHWFLRDFRFGNSVRMVPEETLARAAMFHAIFIVFMLVGLRVRLGGYVDRAIARFPEPSSERMYVVLISGMFLFGMSPYIFFTNEPFYIAVWNDIVGGRAGGALWSVGRTGNVNFSYGAYLAQVLQVAQFASILGAFFAICITRTWAGRVFGIAVWVPSALLGFGTGSRGALVLVALPVVGFFFIRYQAEAAAVLQRVSLRAYAYMGATLMVILVFVQVQVAFRNEGFRSADLQDFNVANVQGNSMFSESLKGFELIPEYMEPFYARIPGESLVRPIPDALYWFVVSPMPRAIWTNKPIDPVWLWYNNVVAGTKGNEGTTISHGAVGYWYFRFGAAGVVQGGLFMGFLMGVAERLLRYHASAKPILIVIALALATFLFRCYRGLAWIELHATMVGMLALGVAVLALRPFFGDREGQGQREGA